VKTKEDRKEASYRERLIETPDAGEKGIPMKISLIIPLLNEEETIDELYGRMVPACREAADEHELIFVNDGSTDNSAAVLDRLAGQDERVKVIHFKRNYGQTAALMAGIDAAEGDVLIPLDADLQNDPGDIPKLMDRINEGYDVCSGWRRDRKDSLLRTLPSRVANALISLVSGVHLHDFGCTLKAYRRDVIKGVRLYGEMHRFIPIYSKWQGAKITELVVHHHPRTHGTSKYGLFRTFNVILDLMVLMFLTRYAHKPIYVFGGCGLTSFLLGLGCFALMIYFKYWGGKSFIATPLPVLVALLFIVGFQVILMGFIAELLMRTYHESQNKSVYLVKSTRNIRGN